MSWKPLLAGLFFGASAGVWAFLDLLGTDLYEDLRRRTRKQVALMAGIWFLAFFVCGFLLVLWAESRAI